MRRFSAVFITAGSIRRMTFEAVDPQEAQTLAEKWGVGVDGETLEALTSAQPEAPEPETYNLDDTRRILGGISRTTVYTMMDDGRLDRVPGIRRVLVTAASIKRVAAGPAFKSWKKRQPQRQVLLS